MVRLTGFRELQPFENALRKFLHTAKPKPVGSETISLTEALGRILAEDVRASRDVPPFDRSAVDGYAVRAEDVFEASEQQPKTLTLTRGTRLKRGEAREIWTGGMMPLGANAVMMLENVVREGYELKVLRAVAPFENVARSGEDVSRGELALESGVKLRPWHVALLAAMNRTKVKVSRRPVVAVLSTGSELAKLGSKLKPGQIVGTNNLTLILMVRELGGSAIDLGIVEDDVEAIAKRLELGLRKADLLLVTGGASVGGPDYTMEALHRLGKCEVVAHGIAMRPSKPTGLAIVDGKPVIVLPGNPVAAMIAFDAFARPVIASMLGLRSWERLKTTARLTRNVASTPGYAVFLRVSLTRKNGELYADPVATTGSGVISTMTKADGYVVIPEQREGLEENELVTVHLLI